MWELDHKEDWVLKNWCFWTAVLEKTVESPLDCKEIQPVHPKGDQSWVFIGRTDAEAAILWPPDGKSWLTGKDPDAGIDWRQEEKRMTEDEMVGWHHQLNGHELEQVLGDGKGQGSLACCSPWGHKSWTWLSNWTTMTTIDRLSSQTSVSHLPAACIWLAKGVWLEKEVWLGQPITTFGKKNSNF